MKRIQTKLWLIIAILGTAMWGCGHKKPKPAVCSPENTVGFPNDALKRFYFRNASYWIYRDTASGKEDSVWVDKSRQNIFNILKDTALYRKCYECYYYELFNTAGARTRVWIMPGGVNDNRSYEQEEFKVDFDLDYGQYIRNERFLLDGDNYRGISPSGGKVTFDDSLRVGSTTYHSVLHLKNPKGNRDIFGEAWYAKEVGLVKYVMKDGTVWELTRYRMRN